MIAAIGAFDGFHKGHQALLTRARERADERGTGWGAVTFERHPDALLTSPRFKSLYAGRELGVLEKFFRIPALMKIEFTRRIADMSPGEFLDFISARFGVRGVAVGEGFRFGRNRAGTTEFLERECLARGWTSDIVPVLRCPDGSAVSSTAIREAVSEGDMARAWEMQGHPFFCVAEVVHGNERGRTLGFPTANLGIGPERARMRYGVYAALAFAHGGWHAAAANVGLNPTFDDVGGLRFEANLADFSGDIYGEEIAVFALKHLRDEIRFGSADELVGQMRLDSDAARAVAETAFAGHAGLWKKFEAAITDK
jgi:riboflavin kinase/FMN adenylyltransferase